MTPERGRLREGRFSFLSPVWGVCFSFVWPVWRVSQCSSACGACALPVFLLCDLRFSFLWSAWPVFRLCLACATCVLSFFGLLGMRFSFLTSARPVFYLRCAFLTYVLPVLRLCGVCFFLPPTFFFPLSDACFPCRFTFGNQVRGQGCEMNTYSPASVLQIKCPPFLTPFFYPQWHGTLSVS